MSDKNMPMRHTVLTTTVVAAAVLLAACTGHKKDATQSAARVDGTEITVHQINYRLQRERGLKPDQMDAASRKVLEQLIDEQLIVEKAEKVKMDELPEAQQALLAARREVLSRAYVEQSVSNVAAPTDAAMHAYFDDNDALFSHRRVYTLQEYLGKVAQDKIPELRAMVEGGKSTAEIEAWFKAQNAPFRGQSSTHPAEQIPLNSLKALAATQDGHGLVVSAGDQVHVTYITSSVDAPVSFDKARPAIGQFLAVANRRQVTESNMAALKTAAAIEYKAPFQALAASGPALGTLRDVESAAPVRAADGARVSLPNAPASGVQITLPTGSSGVRVSLPTTSASSVEVRLPSPAPTDAPKK